MRLAEVYGSVMPTLVGLLQLKYQTERDTPFQTDKITMHLLLVTLFVFVIASCTTARPHHHPHAAIVRAKVVILSALLSMILVLRILLPPLGCICLALWIAYSLKILVKLFTAGGPLRFVVRLSQLWYRGIYRHHRALRRAHNRSPV